jgi:SH3-like domain-containing protein
MLNLRADLSRRAATAATLQHGERLAILEAKRRFVRVRTPQGVEGWTDSANLLAQTQMDDLNALAARAAQMPSQGVGTVDDRLNVHINADRDAATFTQIEEGRKIDVVARQVTEREMMADGVRRADDWFLVRTPEGRAGWVLARMVLMEIPDEVAQYAAGHYIMAYRPLGDKSWLWATAEKARQPFDFDSIRVFVYNEKRQGYDTAYVERGLEGYYPMEASADGFSAVVRDKEGNFVKKSYAFDGRRAKLLMKEPYTAPPALPQVREPETFDKENPDAPKPWPERVQAFAKWWLGI